MGKVIMESLLVNSLFKCLLCNELIHSATVINECLHRFCKLCITNYFEKTNNNTCPTCQIVILNPLQTLKSDLTFQRLLYKIFPSEIACKSSLLTTNESMYIQIETKINVYLEYWDIPHLKAMHEFPLAMRIVNEFPSLSNDSLDLFPNESSIILSKCYLECLAQTPLSSIEKFLRIKYSLSPTLKIDLFYKSFLLNTKTERLIDIYYCFDILDKKNLSLDIRFVISPYGYPAILKRIRQSKQPSVPLQIEVLAPIVSSSLSSTGSIDSTLKVKICRSQSSTNDWYIPQSTTSIELPDLVNSCQNLSKYKKKKSSILNKPRRRIRFIPTMVKVPPSIFDCLSNYQYEFDTSNIKQIYPNEKTICKVPPCIRESSSLFDNGPLDLSLK